MKRWGWIGVLLLVTGAGLLVWRATAPVDPRILQGLPVEPHERLDHWEWWASLALVAGAGLLGGALHRAGGPDAPRDEG